MSQESITAVADQVTQNLLAVNGTVGASQVNFANVVSQHQIKDLVVFPNTPIEAQSMIESAYLRGSQPPVGGAKS